MSKQKRVSIVNVGRSLPGKLFGQDIYETLWLKKEVKLRSQGWLLKSEIKEVKVEKVEDGKGVTTVTVETETTPVAESPVANPVSEAVAPVNEAPAAPKQYSEMSVEELKAECDKKSIKYHHASKETKLISLLEA